MGDNVNNTLTAVGAMSEVIGFFYKKLTENGMSEAQALELCKVWLIKTL